MRARTAFFSLQLSEPEGRGGTAIELASLETLLQARGDVRCVPFPVFRRRPAAAPDNPWDELRLLLSASEATLLLLYPKIPFLGYSGVARRLPLAFLGYAALALKKRLSRQRLVVLVTDLPVEQRRLTEPLAPQELPCALQACCQWQNLDGKDRALSLLEGLLFRQAEVVVALSRPMAEHIRSKHHLPAARVILRGRNAYCPPVLPAGPLPAPDASAGPHVFYSGDLIRPGTVHNLRTLLPVFARHPQARFYLCGRQGEWLQRDPDVPSNVCYLGALDYATHDALARRCQVGLIAYSLGYAHLTPTTKYSAYLANGLAVLAAQSLALSEAIAEDGVGRSVPLVELAEVLESWLEDPQAFAVYRSRALALRDAFWQGNYRQDWLEQL